MYRGLYTATIGMMTQMNRMDALTNNIANVNTTGYKKDTVATRSFADELMSRLDDPQSAQHANPIGALNMGVFVDDIYTDFSQGSLQQTDGKLDTALTASGFYCVNVKNPDGSTQEMYTRDGAFSLGPDGSLLTLEGNQVIGQNGPIVLPQGDISIDESGNISVDGQQADQLKIVDFGNLHSLRKTGDNLYTTTSGSQQKAYTGQVEEGFLEGSNVNSVKEMVDMINISRIYEANSKMLTSQDTLLGEAVSQIASR